MDQTVIISTIIHYGSAIMAVLLALVTAVTMTVEVVKRLIPRVPTDLVVFVVSIAGIMQWAPLCWALRWPMPPCSAGTNSQLCFPG